MTKEPKSECKNPMCGKRLNNTDQTLYCEKHSPAPEGKECRKCKFHLHPCEHEHEGCDMPPPPVLPDLPITQEPAGKEKNIEQQSKEWKGCPANCPCLRAGEKEDTGWERIFDKNFPIKEFRDTGAWYATKEFLREQISKAESRGRMAWADYSAFDNGFQSGREEAILEAIKLLQDYADKKSI